MSSNFNPLENYMITNEQNYDREALKVKARNLTNSMTSKQRGVYDILIDSIKFGNSSIFFLYRYNGTRKSYIWRALTSYLRCKGSIILIVASSGITLILLLEGCIAHSRFAILLDINEDSQAT